MKHYTFCCVAIAAFTCLEFSQADDVKTPSIPPDPFAIDAEVDMAAKAIGIDYKQLELTALQGNHDALSVLISLGFDGQAAGELGAQKRALLARCPSDEVAAVLENYSPQFRARVLEAVKQEFLRRNDDREDARKEFTRRFGKLYSQTEAVAKAINQPPLNKDYISSVTKNLEAMQLETIPRLKFKNITFQKGFNAIKKIWERNHPDAAFPAALTDYQRKDAKETESVARVTADLKDIPYAVALEQLANLTGRTIRNDMGIIEIDPFIRERRACWGAHFFTVPPKALATLGLKEDSSEEEIWTAFAKVGVTLNKEFGQPHLANHGKMLMLNHLQIAHETISGLLVLLGSGAKFIPEEDAQSKEAK